MTRSTAHMDHHRGSHPALVFDTFRRQYFCPTTSHSQKLFVTHRPLACCASKQMSADVDVQSFYLRWRGWRRRVPTSPQKEWRCKGTSKGSSLTCRKQNRMIAKTMRPLLAMRSCCLNKWATLAKRSRCPTAPTPLSSILRSRLRATRVRCRRVSVQHICMLGGDFVSRELPLSTKASHQHPFICALTREVLTINRFLLRWWTKSCGVMKTTNSRTPMPPLKTHPSRCSPPCVSHSCLCMSQRLCA